MIEPLILLTVGFLVGFLVGITLDVRLVRAITHPRKDGHVRIPHPRLPSIRGLAVVTLLASTLVVLTGLSAWKSYDVAGDLVEYVDCKSRYDQELAKALRARTRAGADAAVTADDAWEAMDSIVSAVYSDDMNALNEALGRYLSVRTEQVKARAEQEAVQAVNPLPPFPRDVCGRPPASAPLTIWEEP